MERYIKLKTPKDLDIITDIKFAPFNNQLLVSSWDNRVLLYDCNHIECSTMTQEIQTQTPILCMTHLSKNNNAYMGSLNGTIQSIDYENGKLINENFTKPSGNDDGINNINCIDDLIVSSTFDKKFQVNDPRSSSVAVTTKTFNQKILKMDTNSQYVILALSNRTIEIYDKRDWSSPVEIRESPFDLQVNSLKAFPNGEGFAISSIDGRVGMEYFANVEDGDSKRFAFRCHRQTDKLTNTQIAYPVNSLAFDKTYLYTTGSDGVVNVWNWINRKKNSSFNQLKYENNEPESIVCSDVNYKKDVLAIATSDDGFKTKDLDYSSSIPEFPSSVYVVKL